VQQAVWAALRKAGAADISPENDLRIVGTGSDGKVVISLVPLGERSTLVRIEVDRPGGRHDLVQSLERLVLADLGI